MIVSHAHYSHKRYDLRYLTGQLTAEEGNRDGLLKRLRESGVALCIEPAIDFDSNRLTAALYRQHPDFPPGGGRSSTRTAQVPWRAKNSWPPGPGGGGGSHGRTGLDYHRPRHHRLVQLLWFRYQLDLARRTGLPLVLHIRMADRDALPMLRRRQWWLPGGGGALLPGRLKRGRQYLDLGLCLGIGGALLRRVGPLRETVAQAPLDRLLVETDSPYVLPDIPWEGQQKSLGRVAPTPPCCCPGSLRRSHGSGCRRRRGGSCAGKYPAGVPPAGHKNGG